MENPKFTGEFDDESKQIEFCYSRRREDRACGGDHGTIFCDGDTLNRDNSKMRPAEHYETAISARTYARTENVVTPLLNDGSTVERINRLGSIVTALPVVKDSEDSGEGILPLHDEHDPALD